MIAETAVEFKVDGVRERLLNLEQWLARAAKRGTGEHEVEGHLFREMLALGGAVARGLLEIGGAGRFGKRSRAGRWANDETLP